VKDWFRGLMVLADDAPRWKRDPLDQARAACEGGASCVQLRAKHATDVVALDWAEAIRELTRKFGIAFTVNDRFDLALAAEADGVHLGQADLPPHRLPGRARSRLALGLSTHSLQQAKSACAEPIDYLAFGPVFGTHSKDSPGEPRGTDLLAEVVALVHPRPVIAIGGIGLDNANRVAETGAAGMAVISVIANAADPIAATAALNRILRGGA
jgi:thiamine-phosphate pyrophosphorylase